MKKKSLYSYFAFGYNYCLLKSSPLSSFEDPYDRANSFIARVKDLDLQVTLKAAADLIKMTAELEGLSGDDVPASTVKRFSAELDAIDKTLDAELMLRKSYLLTKKIYALEDLMDTPQQLLGSGTWNSMSDHAKQDFHCATVQIALSQPTGSAFHLMRALEDHVKTLYYSYKKTKRLAKPMWGPMTDELRRKNNPRPTFKLLDHLDSMRRNFRNPTQHPEIFYTMDEAQELLSHTIGAMNMICRELR